MCQDIKVTIDRQFPLMTEWQVLHFLFLNWLAHLISISPREWWNRQGHYAKPSLEYALTLMLVSITVLSNWLYFILSVFFKACFVFFLICLTYLRHLKRRACALYILRTPRCLTCDFLGTCLPLLNRLVLPVLQGLWDSSLVCLAHGTPY